MIFVVSFAIMNDEFNDNVLINFCSILKVYICLVCCYGEVLNVC